MFEYLRKIFSSPSDENKNHLVKDENKKIQIAACALFIELAKADGEFSEEEKQFIISEMNKTFNLDKQCTNELLELAELVAKDSVSIYEFTGIINQQFTQDEKIKLLESLWRLIYQDEKLNAYEDQLIKKIGATLNIEHKQIINAKLLVKEQLGLK
jgi:uncharacterized tellurite resistance protein B-like protein